MMQVIMHFSAMFGQALQLQREAAHNWNNGTQLAIIISRTNHDVYVSMFLPCRVVSAVDCSAFQDLLSQQEHHEAVLPTTDPHN